DQAAVVSSLEIDVSLLLETLVDHTVQGVGGSDGRYRAKLAVGKDAADFALAREAYATMEHLLDGVQAHLAGRRQNRQHEAALFGQYHTLSEAIGRDMAGLCGPRGRIR